MIHTAIGATFRRWRHPRLRSVSQLQEARKPASTWVSHLLSTQPIQTATDATAVSLTDPAGRSAYDRPGDDRARSERTELVHRARRPRRRSCQRTRAESAICSAPGFNPSRGCSLYVAPEADRWPTHECSRGATLYLFPTRNTLSAARPPGTPCSDGLGGVASATRMARSGGRGTRFHIRKSVSIWEPPYGIEP